MQATTWILDVTHRARRFTCDVPPGARALATVRVAAQRELGLELGVPLGVRTPDTAPELLFLVSRAGEGAGWTPLPAFAAADERGFAFYVEAMLGGWAPPTRDLDVFHFGDGPEIAATLVHLVMKGVKRGTAGWTAVAEREGAQIPRVGLVSIVTDGFGHAQCAIRTERVEHLRFGDIDATHAWVEGEGDRTLEDWREGHQAYFRHEGEHHGLTFDEDSMVFFEHFRLLAVFGRPDPQGP
jgi:uncharacterized protein YhfF